MEAIEQETAAFEQEHMRYLEDILQVGYAFKQKAFKQKAKDPHPTTMHYRHPPPSISTAIATSTLAFRLPLV